MADSSARQQQFDYPDGLAQTRADGGPAPSLLRRLLPTLTLGLFIGAAFTGIYGGVPNTTYRKAGHDVAIEANVPRVLRSGEFFEMRFRIEADAPLADATLAIDRSYLHELTINTKLPEAEKEETVDGAYRFSYGPLAAGEALDVKFDGQVNPNLFLGTAGDVKLADGDREIARLPLKLTVLP